MRFFLISVWMAVSVCATTIEKLSVDQMVAQSTAIVRGRVTLSHVQQHGAIYYTHYKVQVQERLKGPEAKTIDVVLPGGTIGRSQQTFSGVPLLASNTDLVLFLWTSKSGVTHLIGLSQGVLQVTKTADGQVVLSREPIREGIVSSVSGRAVNDGGVRITMSDLVGRIRTAGVTR